MANYPNQYILYFILQNTFSYELFFSKKILINLFFIKTILMKILKIWRKRILSIYGPLLYSEMLTVNSEPYLKSFIIKNVTQAIYFLIYLILIIT